MTLSAMDNNTSTNAVQQHSTNEIESDESVDYTEECSLDWDTFSYESEISIRANIYQRNLQALKLMADNIAAIKETDENITKELQEYKDVCSGLLSENANACTKYEFLIKEYKNIEQNVENLKAKNKSAVKTIKELEVEESNSLKEYQQLKAALQKGLEMYVTNFNINIITEAVTDTSYEATLIFGEKANVGPIKFVVDRINKKVIDFHVNEVLLPDEEEDIRNKFGMLDNLPGLLCALREIILRK